MLRHNFKWHHITSSPFIVKEQGSLQMTYLHGGLEELKIFLIVLPINGTGSTLIEIKVFFGRHQAQPLLLFWRQARQHLVKDVIVPLFWCMTHDSRLLQEVLVDFSA